MYNVQGTLREWVTRDEVRHFIAKKFRQFVLSYVSQRGGNGEREYIRLIKSNLWIFSIAFAQKIQNSGGH